MATYYRISCTFSVDLDNPLSKPKCTTSIADEMTDLDGMLLQKEEKRFYEMMLGTIGETIGPDSAVNAHSDCIYQERWYSDPDHKNEIARVSASENAVLQYLLDEMNGSDHVVDGERCSTRTAAKIGEWIEEGRWADTFRTRERLYRKRTGRFFVEESEQRYINRPLWEDTKYHWITTEEAQRWVKEHAPECYEDLFGDVKEDKRTVLISALIRRDTKAKMDRIKAVTGQTIGEIVDEAVDRLLETEVAGLR